MCRERRRCLVAEIRGEWDATRLRRIEDFACEDGSTVQQVRTLARTGPDNRTGPAPGVIGLAVEEDDSDRFK